MHTIDESFHFFVDRLPLSSRSMSKRTFGSSTAITRRKSNQVWRRCFDQKLTNVMTSASVHCELQPFRSGTKYDVLSHCAIACRLIFGDDRRWIQWHPSHRRVCGDWFQCAQRAVISPSTCAHLVSSRSNQPNIHENLKNIECITSP